MVCIHLALVRQSWCRCFDEFHRSRLLQNLVSQQTAGYAISVLFACCFTQMCFAVTEAHTSHGYKVFPTHFSSYIAAEQPFRHRKFDHGGRSGRFKASNHQLGSAMKSNNEQFDLRTVTRQNGFSSTIAFGVPTFTPRLIVFQF
jgi:hypothetical protein